MGKAGHKRKENNIMVYEWKGRKFSVNANVVGAEVEKIEKQKGEVTAKDLVNAARKEDSPLHKLFEWNEAVAAENFRIHQASVILCTLSIVQTDTPEPTVVRAYMNVADDADNPTRRTGTFINTHDAFMDKEKRDLILRVAIRELQELKRKYSVLSELAEVFRAIDNL